VAPAEAVSYLLNLLDVPNGITPLVGLSPQLIRRRTFAVLHELFLKHSQRQPLLVVIENLHWLDPTSQEYLAEWVERLTGMSVLLLVTFRPGYRAVWMEKSYSPLPLPGSSRQSP
jgi:predicted ATPase